MKKTYLFPFLFCAYFSCFSQSGCSDAQAHIIYAYNNAKTALEANNLTDLKYYANKALESFKMVQSVLGTCNCENVENYTYESIQKLSKVPDIEKKIDAQYFVAKARDYAQKIITDLDYCTASNQGVTLAQTNETSELEKEQQKLKQQQEALLKQQEALKQKLAKQKEEQLFLEKQQLIVKSNAAISKNIEAYNELLSVCNCNTTISENTVEENEGQLISKSVDEIKMYYIKSIKDLTSNYMNMLSTCDSVNED